MNTTILLDSYKKQLILMMRRLIKVNLLKYFSTLEAVGMDELGQK
jgi:hypothetical protein